MKPKRPPTPILICIPYWEGDKHQAMDLCKIIAGLQPHHVGSCCHVMLVARQDCAIDQNMVKIISRKFNTFTYKTNSPLRGWPAGPNGMFGNTMIHISNNAKDHYECVYWMEPDCTPLCPNWFWDLYGAWKERHPDANIVGCRSDCHGDGTGSHITGCALYHPNIARIFPAITSCEGTAWDYLHRDRIIRMGGHTNSIENWYKARNAAPGTENRDNVGVRVIHGFKDRSLIELVAKRHGIGL